MFLRHILSVIYLVMYSLKRNSINHRFTTKEYCLVWSKWQKYLIEGLFKEKRWRIVPKFLKKCKPISSLLFALDIKKPETLRNRRFFYVSGGNRSKLITKICEVWRRPLQKQTIIFEMVAKVQENGGYWKLLSFQ